MANYLVEVTNPNTYNLTNYPTRIDLAGYVAPGTAINVLDLSNNPLVFSLENSLGEVVTDFALWDTSVIWVKLTIPAGGTTQFKVVEGTAGTPVNGDAMFLFYDDFNDGVIDTGKWIVFGSPTESGGVLTASGTGTHAVVAASAYYFGGDLTLEMLAQYVGGRPLLELHNDVYGPGWQYAGFDNYTQSGFCIQGGIYNTCLTGVCNAYPGDWRKLTVKIKRGAYVRGWVGDTFWGEVTTCIPTDPLGANLGVVSGTVYVDWVRVRPLADQEPTYTINLLGGSTYDVTVPQSTMAVGDAKILVNGVDVALVKMIERIVDSRAKKASFQL